MTIFFGIIHGLGFGRYFKMLIFDDAVTISLFSFALGIELAQVTIVVFVLFTSWLILKIFKNSNDKKYSFFNIIDKIKEQKLFRFIWTDEKVIDFVNWYISYCSCLLCLSSTPTR